MKNRTKHYWVCYDAFQVGIFVTMGLIFWNNSWSQLLFWSEFCCIAKAELLREGIIFLIHLFARAILLMKKLKIEKTKAT